jgi:ElaB/YqjD/DUF883 family membrane-anchored ribosome-binding protein
MTAQHQYQQIRTEINSLIEQLNRLLNSKDMQAEKEPENWGHAGDLGHVKEQLTNIVNILK